MFFASSHPHNDFSIKGLGPRIPVWPMDLSSHLCVRLDTTVDGRVAVRRGRVVRVVGDVGCRLALAGQSPSQERGALLAFMWGRLRKRKKLITNYAELNVRLEKWVCVVCTHLALYSSLLRLPWWCAGPGISNRRCRPASCKACHSGSNHLSTMRSQHTVSLRHHHAGTYTWSNAWHVRKETFNDVFHLIINLNLPVNIALESASNPSPQTSRSSALGNVHNSWWRTRLAPHNACPSRV